MPLLTDVGILKMADDAPEVALFDDVKPLVPKTL